MVILRLSKLGVYIKDFINERLTLTSDLNKAKVFNTPEVYDIDRIKEDNPELFFYLSYLQKYNMKAEMDELDE